MRTVTRRQVLQAGGAVAALQFAGPIVFRGSAWADVDPSTAARRRLVLLDLGGGNDGLNTVVPMAGGLRDVYDTVRLSTNLAASSLQPLGATNGGDVGLNQFLPTLYAMWQANRVAIVQGVDYPNHNYSHFVSDDIWQSGRPDATPGTGWLGRHLDRVGIGAGELRGVGVGFDRLPLALGGENVSGEEINSVYETQFQDGGQSGVPGIRHQLFAGYDAATMPTEAYYGQRCRGALDLAVATTGLTTATPGGVANALLTARTLLEHNLGVEVVIVGTGGYDTHENELAAHQNLMMGLDRGLEAFFFGTANGAPILDGVNAIGALDPNVASRTLVMTYSEFGRRIGDNGGGTDHGAAAPQFLIGPPTPAPGSGDAALVPGLHGDHPDMGTVTLPADNLAMTTDLRSVYQAVLTHWVNDPTGASPDEGDPLFQLSGTGLDADGSLSGLFTVA